MSSLFRVRVLAVSGTGMWCAVAGRLTVSTSGALHQELTAKCADALTVVLDLREVQLFADAPFLEPPWPKGSQTVHLVAPSGLRAHTSDPRVHWHTELDTAWQAWCAAVQPLETTSPAPTHAPVDDGSIPGRPAPNGIDPSR